MSESEFTMPDGVAEALVVRPGDVLLLRLPARVSPEQFQRFRDDVGPKLTERLPGVQVVFIGGVEQMAAYRLEELAVAEGGVET